MHTRVTLSASAGLNHKGQSDAASLEAATIFEPMSKLVLSRLQ